MWFRNELSSLAEVSLYNRNDLRVLEIERLFQDIIASVIPDLAINICFCKVVKSDWKIRYVSYVSVRTRFTNSEKNHLPSRRVVLEFYIGDVYQNLSSGLKFV